MHNLSTILRKFTEITKTFAGNLVDKDGNIPRRGPKPMFSDIEVIALSMAQEYQGIDSENMLFHLLSEYKKDIPNLISRRQYNDRRKQTSDLSAKIRERMVLEIDGHENVFCIDSKPLPVCRLARHKRNMMGRDNYEKSPSLGHCAAQGMRYFGYKIHAVCGLNGTIHSFDLTKASVHDLNYTKDVKQMFNNCTIIGDKGYIGKQVQLDLFESANIRLEVPYRKNQKDKKPCCAAFAVARKRIETVFSQLQDQFMIERNYAKAYMGYFTRILAKIASFTILQYINLINGKPIGRVKHALI